MDETMELDDDWIKDIEEEEKVIINSILLIPIMSTFI